jgi:hypothetical protein
MDVPNQFKKIGFLFTNDGAVAILKEMAGAVVSEVKVDGVSGEQAPHKQSKTRIVQLKEEMCMVWHEGPRKAFSTSLTQQRGEFCDKSVSIDIIDEYGAAIYSTYDNVLEKFGGIKAGGTGHN